MLDHVHLVDAASSMAADPTRTVLLRKKFRHAAKLKLRRVRGIMRQGVIDQNILGLGEVSFHPPVVRQDAFNHWIKTVLVSELSGDWVKPYISLAWMLGETEAIEEVPGPALPPYKGQHLVSMTQHEVEGIIGALTQQLTRCASIQIERNQRRPRAFQKLLLILDKVAARRFVQLCNTYVVKTFNAAKLAVYRERGLSLVGLVPESVRRSLQQDAAEVVGIQTAGDIFVCQACEDYAAGAPYALDDVDLPLHPECRCGVFPWHDQNYHDAYDPNEERDWHGRWTAGGGSESESAVGFVSPNVENLNFENAKKNISSSRQHALVAASQYIDNELGIHSENHAVIGAWSDGAENSMMTTFTNTSYEEAKVASAMKAWIADQKAALVFQPNAGGKQFMAAFEAKGSLDEIHNHLLQSHVTFHTLEPRENGAVVHVYGDGQETLDKVSSAAEHYGSQVKVTKGDGEFVGTTKEDGTDREQRDDARRIYESVIENAGKLHGRDPRAIWKDVRDRWPSLNPGIASEETLELVVRGEHGRLLGKEEIQHKLEAAAIVASSTPDTSKINTPEREHMRQRIVDELYNRGIDKRVRGRTVTLVYGLPGAGKSFFSNPLVEAGALEVDPDLAKAQIPEYNGGAGAFGVHEESSQITQRVLDRAIRNGDNIVWPRLNSPAKAAQIVKDFKEAGYAVHVKYIDVTTQTAAKSVVERFLRTGRYVPPKVIEEFGSKSLDSFTASKLGATTAEVWRRAKTGRGFERVE